MTTRVMVVTNLSAGHECRIHTERRGPDGRFARDENPLVVKGPANQQLVELYLPDGGQVVVSEHHTVGQAPA